MTNRYNQLGSNVIPQIRRSLRWMKRVISRFGVDCGLVIALAALVALFFWRLQAPYPEDRLRFTPGDFTMVFYPARYFVASSLAQGHLPLWNPYIYAGYPAHADPQGAPFYPLSLLTALLTGQGMTIAHLQAEAVAHYFLAALFTYLFARYLLKHRLAAFGAALIFTFGGYLTGYPALQVSELESDVWLPLALLSVTYGIDKDELWPFALGGMSLAMVFLAGRPQSYLTILPLTLAWFVYRSLRKKCSWGEIGGRFMILGGVALGVAAVQMLPFTELTRLSDRAEFTLANARVGGFSFWELGGLLSPRLVGSGAVYAGVLTLGLVALAVIKLPRSRFWLAGVVVALFFSVGKHTVLFDLTYLAQKFLFPGYLRNPERLAFAVNFCLAILAGYGLVSLKEDSSLLRRVLAVGLGLSGLIVLGLLTWRATIPGDERGDVSKALANVIFLTLLVGAGYLVITFVRKRWQQGMLIALLAVDLLTINRGASITADRGYIFAPFTKDPLAALSLVKPILDQPGVFRFHVEGSPYPDSGTLLVMESVDGMPPLHIRHFQELRYAIPEHRALSLLNVHYVIADRTLDPSFYQPVWQQEDDWVGYVLKNYQPRAYLVSQIEAVSDEQAALERLGDPSLNLATAAVVFEAVEMPTPAPLSSGETVEILSRGETRIHLAVHTQQERLLVYAGIFYPGWRAFVDGKPAPIYRTNLALRGIVVPRGQHEIVMLYRPLAFYAGATISGLTTLLVGAWLVVLAVRRSNR